jgi:hypothetical protein
MSAENLNRIVHCHVVRITEPGQGDQPVIVEWKVPDPEPMVPNPFGSHITVSIAPNFEQPVFMEDIAPEHRFDYTIVSPGYVSSINLDWTVDPACSVSDEGYLTTTNDYGVEFWLRVQHENDQGPGRPFDPDRWFVYRYHRCSFTGRVNFREWAAVAHPENKQIYTMSVVTSTDDKKEES